MVITWRGQAKGERCLPIGLAGIQVFFGPCYCISHEIWLITLPDDTASRLVHGQILMPCYKLWSRSILLNSFLVSTQISFEREWLHFLKQYIVPVNGRIFPGYHSEVRINYFPCLVRIDWTAISPLFFFEYSVVSGPPREARVRETREVAGGFVEKRARNERRSLVSLPLADLPLLKGAHPPQRYFITNFVL